MYSREYGMTLAIPLYNGLFVAGCITMYVYKYVCTYNTYVWYVCTYVANMYICAYVHWQFVKVEYPPFILSDITSPMSTMVSMYTTIPTPLPTAT